MTVKNTSGKIIAFGSTTILPGEIGEIDKSWENNSVVEMYLERGTILRVSDAPSVTPDDSSVQENKSDNADAKEPETKEPEVKETKSKK